MGKNTAGFTKPKEVIEDED